MAIAAKPAQEFVPIKEINDGVVIMRDGSLRALIVTSSINFALQSEENQTAIITQFQNFLNALDFSVEIYVQSRRMDIKPYLQLLQERYKQQPTELLKIQTQEYIEFVKTFVDNVSIMTKTFIVVIPYSSSVISIKKNPLESITGIFAKKNPEDAKKDMDTNFEANKIQLQQRIAVVEQGLSRCGLRIARLGTEELVELFYKLFNPGETDKPMITDKK